MRLSAYERSTFFCEISDIPAKDRREIKWPSFPRLLSLSRLPCDDARTTLTLSKGTYMDQKLAVRSPYVPSRAATELADRIKVEIHEALRDRGPLGLSQTDLYDGVVGNPREHPTLAQFRYFLIEEPSRPKDHATISRSRKAREDTDR